MSLGNSLGFNHPNPRSRFQRGEVLRGYPYLVSYTLVSLEIILIGWGVPGVGTLAPAALEVGELLNHITHGQPNQTRVLRATLPVGQMAVSAAKNLRRSAVRHDVRHRSMIGRMPVRRIQEIRNLRERERRLAIRHMSLTRIRRWRRGSSAWRVDGEGPIRRRFVRRRRFCRCKSIRDLGILRSCWEQEPAIGP